MYTSTGALCVKEHWSLPFTQQTISNRIKMVFIILFKNILIDPRKILDISILFLGMSFFTRGINAYKRALTVYNINNT